MIKENMIYMGKKYYFEVTEKDIKNFNLKVNSSKVIRISVPIGTTIEYIKDFIKRKIGWINKQFEYYDSLVSKNEKLSFVDGETIYLLGKQYKLKVVLASENQVTVGNKYLTLNLREKIFNNKIQIQKVYNSWLKNYAHEQFIAITKKYQKPLKKYEINLPEIEIRKMRTRWGSCVSKAGKVIYNLDLIKAPVCCIEYVVLHELIHFKYQKHNDNFYKFLTIFMPDWKQRKKILDDEYGLIS